MLLDELDLLHLLGSDRVGIKQSESQERRKQHTQKPPTRGYRVSVSNELLFPDLAHVEVLRFKARESRPLIHQCARSTASTVVIPAIIEPAIAIAAGMPCGSSRLTTAAMNIAAAGSAITK